MTQNVAVLDCSSLDTTIASLATWLETSGPTLRDRLSHCEIDWHHRVLPPKEQVLRHLGYETEKDLPSPAAIRWFHATRAFDDEEFEEGLLPTMAALPKLWKALGRVAARWTSAAEWERYQRDFESADRLFASQFRHKRVASGWEGPFAFLVKEAALGRVGDHKDFTAICETLEDICADYEEVSGYPIRAAYEAATRPCIVVFTRPGDWHGAVAAAINYAHRSLNGLDHGVGCNANFSGEGEPVPRQWIESIEWPIVTGV